MRRLIGILSILIALSGCRAVVNPFEPDQRVNYYGERVSMKWLQAFKTVHCLASIQPGNGQAAGEILCFDTQQEVFQEVERRNATE
jgi:hypothetical protein